MHQLTRAKALGGQQALRLQQLQELSDDLIHRAHLQHHVPVSRSQQPSPQSEQTKAAALPSSSRAVEAVLEARQSTHGSTAVRLRSKIEEARGSIRTERSERPDHHYNQQQQQQQRRVEDDTSNQSHEPLVPPLFTRTVARSRATSSSCAVDSGGSAAVNDGTSTRLQARGSTTTATTRRRIGAVRRRNNPEREPEQQTKRKLSKEELEWVEKQLLFAQRVAVLERECESWWRQFYSASGVNSGQSSATAAQIHIGFEELENRRTQDTRQMTQQLHALRQKLRGVSAKLDHMRNGETFYADLQALIEDLETAIAVFRRSQRERYDEFAVDERVLEKELDAFVEQMNDWENEASNNNISSSTARAAASRASNRRAMSRAEFTRVGSKAALQGKANPAGDDPAEAEAKEEQANESDMMARVRRLNDLILQSGGMKGGWDDREHRIFTSLLATYGLTDDVLLKSHRFQFKSLHGPPNQESNDEGGDAAIDCEATVARFLQKCIKQVVTKSDKAVRCHFIWYLDHIQLIQQKKDAISEWRTRKERERQQIIYQGLVEDNPENDICTGTSPDRQQLGSGVEIAAKDEKKTILAGKTRAKKEKLLLKWEEEKEKREQEQRRQQQELASEKEAREAKRKQELLEAKQKVLLYKLQKEQEGALAEKARSGRHSQPPSSSPGAASVSLVSKEDLMERSRQAIEYAKAKRAKLQEMEATRQKQCALPERPQLPEKRASPKDTGSGNTSPALLLQPTKASQARELSKIELRKKDKARQRQNAHEAYIPGAGAIPDVKLKSFGHIAIQPRAVPAWRRNI